jgi:fibronectin type 3 domain-containing protein
VKVSWLASSDNAGIAAYDVYRSTYGTTFSKHGTTQNLNYYDETVTRGETYWYYVVARDFSDNSSAPTEVMSQDA